MFVISGVTGHTGAVVASTLLAGGHQVRVIVRDAKKGEPWQQRGAEVAVAELANVEQLTRALAGASGVYALVPPAYEADELLAAQVPVIDAWQKAISRAKPKHVVLLSSVGAHLDGPTGPIRSLHRTEAELRATGVPLTAVRAAYFMENWAAVLAPMKGDGVLPSTLTPGRAVEMVATEDIGRVAAEALLKGPGAGAVIELTGPRPYTPEEVTAEFGRALGRKLTLLPVPDEAIELALGQAGMKPKVAALMHEMIAGVNRGYVVAATAPTRGRIGLDAVAKKLVG
jgi:NAD(P)H dehydrogenase (quinone)